MLQLFSKSVLILLENASVFQYRPFVASRSGAFVRKRGIKNIANQERDTEGIIEDSFSRDILGTPASYEFASNFIGTTVNGLKLVISVLITIAKIHRRKFKGAGQVPTTAGF